MTMKRYRLRLDYSYYLNLLAYKKIARRGVERFPYQCIAQPRIIAESLFLRVQEAILILSGRALESIAYYYDHICPYIDYAKVQLPENIQCKIVYRHDLKQCIRHSGLRQCNYCLTEYQIDLQEYGRFGVVVLITKWLDLGEGRTFMDPKWWSHLSIGYTNHNIFASVDGVYKTTLRDRVPISFEAGSIYTLFEAFDPLLTLKEVKKLSKC
jgi:hypothetical protein